MKKLFNPHLLFFSIFNYDFIVYRHAYFLFIFIHHKGSTESNNDNTYAATSSTKIDDVIDVSWSCIEHLVPDYLVLFCTYLSERKI